MRQEIVRRLAKKADSKIVLLILDGLGDLPIEGKTALERAYTPNIDSICSDSIFGTMDPLSPGITPGSGPAHLALFGYDPFCYDIGRGLLSALGIGFSLREGDVCCRGNFCTVENGIITDRRAGRISTERNRELCKILQKIKIEGVETFVEPIKEHRFLLVFRGERLSSSLSDTDPQREGSPPLSVEGEKRTASLFNQWIDRAKEVLRDCIPANMVLLRGFASYLSIPKFSDLYKMRACCIATYPMYKGIARLLGMDVAEGAESVGDQFGLLAENYSSYDFFFLHIKETDKAGEDGDQRKKCEVIEEVDRLLPRILELKPDLLVITGDHSTPASLRSHSFHPVPLLIHTKHCIPDGILRFSEREARLGSLGRFPMQELMGILLGLSMRLAKYGA